MTRRLSVSALSPALMLFVAAGALADPPRTVGDEDITKEIGQTVVDGPDGDIASFDSENMTMLAHFPLNSFPGGSNSGNDCWGYVSPSGREYAIMGLERGYGFVEVTDPSNPVIVDYVSGPASLWHDIKVMGDYAYGVSEGGSGIQVIDLSDIDNGTVNLVRNKTQQGHSSTHNIVANTDSGFLYLVGANIQNGGLIAVNTTDPEDPVIVGAWNDMYVHDAQVVSYTEGQYAGREIAFCLSGFSGGFSQTGLRIVDVTDKSNMFTLATISWSGAQYSHQGWLSEDRQYFYINDEIDEGNTVSVTTTRVFDVSDLSNPSFEGTFSTGLPATDHNLYTHNGLIFQSNYRSGLRVFDYSQNPTSPTEIAWFDSYSSNDGVGYNGAWSNYPYLPSGTIILSDIESGLFILRLEGVRLNLVNPQDKLDPNTPLDVTVEIVESFSEYDEQTVTLNYSQNGGANQEVQMDSLGGDFFRGTLPGGACFDTFDYSVSVLTDSGTVASSQVVSALVYQDQLVEVDYDGESTGGWTVGASGDNATTGVWNRQNPNSTDAQPEDDVSDDGVNCWVTDGRGGSLGDYDVDGGRTTLNSPVYDVSAINDPYLGVWIWYSNNTGNDPNNDIFRVEFSSNGGSSWSSALTLGPSDGFSNGGWFYHEVRISDVVTPNSDFRARFIAEDANDGSIVEAAVDELTIYGYSCEDCVADFNGDGNVNTQDVLAFLNAWSNGEDEADVNNDGNVNTQDVLEYLNLWNDGC